MDRQKAVSTVATLVETAKNLLSQAQRISEEHGLAFDFDYSDNLKTRDQNGWDASGCTIEYDDGGWDSSNRDCW